MRPELEGETKLQRDEDMYKGLRGGLPSYGRNDFFTGGLGTKGCRFVTVYDREVGFTVEGSGSGSSGGVI